MADITKIPVKELLFDRQEAFNDLTIAKLVYDQGTPGSEERLKGNLEAIGVITNECKRRGFDPGIYDQVHVALYGKGV